jgi:organic hydroperoxide reductase OsmC/OhrA
MTGKTGKQFFFEVQLNWGERTNGILTANDTEGSIHVGTPPEFGGDEKTWSSEHLLLGAVSSSFMATYLAFAKKSGFEVSHFECNVIGQIEIVEGKYKFTNIHVYPKIFIAKKALREKATIALEKTHKSCLIVNSLNAKVFYHSEVIKDLHPGKAIT